MNFARHRGVVIFSRHRKLNGSLGDRAGLGNKTYRNFKRGSRALIFPGRGGLDGALPLPHEAYRWSVGFGYAGPPTVFKAFVPRYANAWIDNQRHRKDQEKGMPNVQ